MSIFKDYIDLSKNDEFQEIYSSQLYGNFFGIFSSFKAGSSNDDCFELNNMELKIINYKGVVNMGISDAELYKLEENRYVLKLEVQALNNQYTCNLNCDNIVIPKGSKILIDRRLKRMHPDCLALRNGLFDNEFFYREGGDVYPERKPKPLEWSEKLSDEIMNNFISDEAFQGDIQCPRRIVSVL